MSDSTIQYVLPAPVLSLPSVYLIPVTSAANQVLAWSADGSAIVMRSVTTAMVTDFASAVGSIVTASINGLSLGSAASHAATDFALASDLAAKAPLNSPALTGTPTAPTQSVSDSSTKLATTALVDSKIAILTNGASTAFDTFIELSTQLATDESGVAALTTTVSGKLAKSSNFSDLTNVATARTNLGLGTAATQNTGTGANQIPTRDSSGNLVGQVTARQQTASEIAGLTPAAGELLQSTTDPTTVVIGDGTTAGGLAIGADVRTLAWNATSPTSQAMNVVYVYTDTRTNNTQVTQAVVPNPQKVGQRVTVVIQVASGHLTYVHAVSFTNNQVSFRNASGAVVPLDGSITFPSGKSFHLISLVALGFNDWLLESTNLSTAELQSVKDNNDS